jgi:hypothetical protein
MSVKNRLIEVSYYLKNINFLKEKYEGKKMPLREE